MSALALHDLILHRVLVTRESARGLAASIRSAIGEGGSALALDFMHVDGITPSFLDELLSVVQEEFDRCSRKEFRLNIVNPPTALSSKFTAIGRGRGLTIRKHDRGWMVEPVEGTRP